jgi:hypothetical protein
MSDPDPDRLETALCLAEAGYHLAPVQLGRNPKTGRKMPVYGGLWSQISTTDPDQIIRWLSDGVIRRHAPIAPEDVSLLVDCSASDVLVVDLDVKPHADPKRSIDGVTTWALEGAPISPMRVETPSGGQHHYWRMPDPPLINSEGLIAPGIDTRGVGGHVFAPGAFILGDDGPGYVLLDPVLPVAELPILDPDIGRLLRTAPAEHRTPEGQRADGRQHDERWIRNAMADQLERVRAHDPATGGFRAVLRGASLVCGRAVTAALIDRSEAKTLLHDAVFGVWGSVDDDDAKWVQTGLDDGICDPWTVTPERPRTLDRSVASYLGIDNARAGGADVDADNVPELEDEADGGYAEILNKRYLWDLAGRESRQMLDARERAPLRRMSAAEFLAADQPVHLVPGMLYRDSLAVVFGPPGAAKTFFTLDLALCLATGTPWRGTELERTRVHYLMAEGQAVNVARTHAWLHHHHVHPEELDEWFVAFPEPIGLTPVGVAEYLAEVQADEPGLIVLDTKHAMMEGDESKAADVKIMRDALTKIRGVCGSCVVLVDHTGLNNEDRARGSGSQRAMVATEVQVTERKGSGVRVAKLTRDTAGRVLGEWGFRLEPVRGVPGVDPELDSPVVPVPVDLSAGTPFGEEAHWWDPHASELPTDVARYQATGKGAIRPLARFMRHNASAGVGMSLAQARKAVLAFLVDPSTGKPSVSPDTVDRAWGALVNTDRIVPRSAGAPNGLAMWINRDGDPDFSAYLAPDEDQ